MARLLGEVRRPGLARDHQAEVDQLDVRRLVGEAVDRDVLVVERCCNRGHVAVLHPVLLELDLDLERLPGITHVGQVAERRRARKALLVPQPTLGLLPQRRGGAGQRGAGCRGDVESTVRTKSFFTAAIRPPSADTKSSNPAVVNRASLAPLRWMTVLIPTVVPWTKAVM